MATKTLTTSGTTFSNAISKIGSSSAYFNGTSYCYAPGGASGNPDFEFGSGDFTLEFWAYSTATNSFNTLMAYGDNGGARSAWWLAWGGTNIQFIATSVANNNWNICNITTSGVTLAQNTWYHIAVVRNGTSIKVYIDGVERGSATSSLSMYDLSAINGSYYYNHLMIGSSYYPTNTYGYGFTGYIDEVRVSKGIARYTAAFTPPTNKFNGDPSTSLLLHFDGIVEDFSASYTDTLKGSLVGYWPLDGHALDMSKNTSLSTNLIAYYKFNSGALTTDSVGSYTLTNNGSVAETTDGKIGNGADFGSTNSSKSFKYNANLGIAGTGAITVSYWWKLSADIGVGVSYYPWAYRSTLTADRYLQISYLNSAGTRQFQIDGSSGYIYGTFSMGTDWHHIVLTRAAGSAATISLYIDGNLLCSGAGGTYAAAGQNYFSLGYEGGSAYASGIMDEVGVWSRALSANEVTQLYNSGLGTQYSFTNTKGYNNGTVTGALPVPSQNPAIPASLAYKFNGSSDYITVPNIAGIKTVSAWVKPASTSQSYLQLTSGIYLKDIDGQINQTGFTSPTIYVNGKKTGLEQNLLSYWKLDESSGNAADSVGSKTLTNNSVTYAAGKINNGAVFNGTSSSLTNTSSFFTDVSGSISLWLKTSVAGTPNQFLFSQGIATVNSRVVLSTSVVANGDLYFDSTVSGVGQLTFYTSSLSLADGNWHHIVMTVDSSGNKIYKDGSQVTTGITYQVGTSATQKWFNIFTADRLNIGNTTYNNFTGGYFNGSLDEIGVWSRALSAQEVAQLYNSGNGLAFPLVEPIRPNVWNHIAVTSDTATTGSTSYIGRQNSTYLNGQVQDVAFFNNVLPQQTIQSIYSQTKTRVKSKGWLSNLITAIRTSDFFQFFFK